MFTAHVLVQGFTVLGIPADSDETITKDMILNFGEFTLTAMHWDSSRGRTLFGDVSNDDWLLEKTYDDENIQHVSNPAGVGNIPNDLADILFLLRLRTVGEIAFGGVVIEKSDGHKLIQEPHRLMNRIFQSGLPFEWKYEDCRKWVRFAGEFRNCPSWNTTWFNVAKRYFLYGTSKEFDPKNSEVDRLLDFAILLEGLLVSEADLIGLRLRERCAALLSNGDKTKSLVKKIYEVRSKIAHGEPLNQKSVEWLSENQRGIERLVRDVITQAAKKLPVESEKWKSYLKGMFEPSDKDRKQQLNDNVGRISDPEVLSYLKSRIEERLLAVSPTPF